MPAQDSLSSTESPAADYGSSSDLPRLEYYLINAFETGKPGSGNQASVVIFPSPSDPRSKDDAFLLRTAQDFGFSETAYLVPIAPEEGRWGLRWFTPEVEVPICGHATLAASRVVLSLYKDLPRVTFETRYWGELVVKRCQEIDTYHTEVEISLSTLPKEALDKISTDGPTLTEELKGPLAQVLSVKTEQVIGVGEFHFVDRSLIIETTPDVDLASIKLEPKALTSYSPAMTIVTQMIPDESSPGTLRTNTRVTFQHFEDPVTGSAHAFITGYYLLTSASSRIPQNVVNGQPVEGIKIDGRQLSQRGGKLRMKLADNGMVRLTGVAVEWGKGSLSV